MSVGWGQQHQAALAELTEWREDLAGRQIGSQVVLLAVPPGWGRTAVLREFRTVTENDGPVTQVAWADVLAWAGGALHASQLDQALPALDAGPPPADSRVIRSGSLARLAGPADARLTGQVAALPARTRYALAAAVLKGAVTHAADPAAGVIERVVARQAAHRVRSDVGDHAGLAKMQCALIRGLEQLGDLAATRFIVDGLWDGSFK